jgi:hypothetical protein
MPINIEPLIGPTYEARYDTSDSISYINYKGVLTSDMTAAVYRWMGEALKQVALNKEELLGKGGCIIDFTKVTGYDTENLATARNKSISMRLEQSDAVSAVPTALIVQTMEQEIMAQTSMQLAKQGKNPRVKIVKSMAEAKKFIEDWWIGWKERMAAEQATTPPVVPSVDQASTPPTPPLTPPSAEPAATPPTPSLAAPPVEEAATPPVTPPATPST